MDICNVINLSSRQSLPVSLIYHISSLYRLLYFISVLSICCMNDGFIVVHQKQPNPFKDQTQFECVWCLVRLTVS